MGLYCSLPWRYREMQTDWHTLRAPAPSHCACLRFVWIWAFCGEFWALSMEYRALLRRCRALLWRFTAPQHGDVVECNFFGILCEHLKHRARSRQYSFEWF